MEILLAEGGRQWPPVRSMIGRAPVWRRPIENENAIK
jgi:hypothetical protein